MHVNKFSMINLNRHFKNMPPHFNMGTYKLVFFNFQFLIIIKDMYVPMIAMMVILLKYK